jgi:beta-phosphoglucomutase family hydrolase
MTASSTPATLGLPEQIRACLFDLDGVLTQTAEVHRAVWTEVFDALLAERAGGASYRPFTEADYLAYVDGRPRRDGVRTFLASREIHLPEGHPDDPPSSDTIAGVANRKNERVLERFRTDGVAVFDGSVRYVEAVRRAGLRTAVVTASANAATVLEAAGIDRLFGTRVDGIVATRERLAGKPEPDTFLAAASATGVSPTEAAVFEDALAGVTAGRAGGFGYVVGVDRADQADALRQNGADVVVTDLADLMEAS